MMSTVNCLCSSMTENTLFPSPHFYFGPGIETLDFVEVIPLAFVPEGKDGSNSGVSTSLETPCLTAPFVKLHLCQTTFDAVSKGKKDIQIQWREFKETTPETDGTPVTGGFRRYHRWLASTTQHDHKPCFAITESSHYVIPVIYIPSERPTAIESCPCWIVGHSSHNSGAVVEALVSDATLVRILPLKVAIPVSVLSDVPSSFPNSVFASEIWKQSLLGEEDDREISESLLDQVFSNHDAETVRALTLRMRSVLDQSVRVGTTVDALGEQETRERRKVSMARVIREYYGMKLADTGSTVNEEPTTSPPTSVPSNFMISLLWDGTLIVHSPHHGHGKTLLVQAIARRRLKCDAVHVIRPGPLLAKYGIHGDAALEAMIHGICVSAAYNHRSVCIILDHLDAMLPPKLSGRTGAGDASIPVLNGIASYLKNLSLSLKRRNEIPFPLKNALYNWGRIHGVVLSLRVCLVGIVTCADDGGRPRDIEGSMDTVLDALGGGRFRLADLSAKCRLQAFQSTFRRTNLTLSEEAANKLPILAASTVDARGDAFDRTANRLVELAAGEALITEEHLGTAMAELKRDRPISTSVEFQSVADKHGVAATSETSLFGSVGGNAKAKLALEEAVAFHPVKRRMLAKFGMKPPSCVMLYGPPGCGKTLLAKAVAKLLKTDTNDTLSLGGAFISLEASELVQSTVGSSEKLLVSAFETARSNAPSVVFIDEFQALFTDRSRGGGGRLASTLLQCMDDMKLWRDADEVACTDADDAIDNGNRVVVMGATNVPWMIDKAFLRPGRFDRVVHVGLPTLQERKQILRVYLCRMRLSIETDRSTAVERVCDALAPACEGFSGADLFALCRAAAIQCLDENGEEGDIELKHFVKAREHDVTSTSDEALVERLANWRP